MTNYVIKVEPGHINMTGASFMTYANWYHESARVLIGRRRNSNQFDPTTYFLMCLSLELHLKSYIWLQDQIGLDKIKRKYGHNIEKLWLHSKQKGIAKHAKPTALRERVIALVGPYYLRRKFNYLDLDMIFSGYNSLKSCPEALPTLSRLCGQLRNSLRQPILDAS